jgi:hypothetical protein
LIRAEGMGLEVRCCQCAWGFHAGVEVLMVYGGVFDYTVFQSQLVVPHRLEYDSVEGIQVGVDRY